MHSEMFPNRQYLHEQLMRLRKTLQGTLYVQIAYLENHCFDLALTAPYLHS